MIDITSKSSTLRIATAQAVVRVSKEETIRAIRENQVPKGDVFAASRATGLLGIKKTADLLPDCHPMPIEGANIDYHIDGLEIFISVQVKTIYKTGVEVEAMHGASIVALNIYDMLKPIDKGVEIHHIKLLNKKGGKSSFPKSEIGNPKAAIIICSDSISNGQGEDRSGPKIKHYLESEGFAVQDIIVLPDDIEQIQAQVQRSIKEVGMLVLSGGTGISPRDITPEAVIPLLDKRITGAEEVMRRYGQDRTPYAMMSRSVVGTIGGSLVLALPGSAPGAMESLDAVMPHLLHSFSVLRQERHDNA